VLPPLLPASCQELEEPPVAVSLPPWSAGRFINSADRDRTKPYLGIRSSASKPPIHPSPPRSQSRHVELQFGVLFPPVRIKPRAAGGQYPTLSSVHVQPTSPSTSPHSTACSALLARAVAALSSIASLAVPRGTPPPCSGRVWPAPLGRPPSQPSSQKGSR
jgi:hypothetical protein